MCMPGERVRIELGFRWDAEPQAVVAHFRKFVGSRFSPRNLGKQIALEGRKIRHVAEGEEAYMFEHAIKVVNGPPAHREREGAWLYGIRFLG